MGTPLLSHCAFVHVCYCDILLAEWCGDRIGPGLRSKEMTEKAMKMSW